MVRCKDPTKELEHRRKQSEAAIRRYSDPTERKRHSLACKGCKKPPVTEKTRKILSKCRMGHPTAHSTKEKISNTLKGHDVPYESRLKTIEHHLGGFWYGNIRYYEGKQYCELWNAEFRRRIRAFNAHNHNGIVTCECCGVIINNGNIFNCHHVYYDKKACCVVSEDGKYYSNLGIKGNPYDFEIIGDPNKFVVLCDSCHGKSTGRKNRRFWARFFEKIVNEKYNGKSFFTKEEIIAFKGKICSNNLG